MIAIGLFFISDMKVFALLIAVIVLFTSAIAEKKEIDYANLLKDVSMALNVLTEKQVRALGIDHSILQLRDELNQVVPEDILKTIRVM